VCIVTYSIAIPTIMHGAFFAYTQSKLHQRLITPAPIPISHAKLQTMPRPSYLVIMKHKIDIPRPLRVIPHEVFISLGPLLLRITRQHALQTHTHALDIMHR
jgi:hypothetical protein